MEPLLTPLAVSASASARTRQRSRAPRKIRAACNRCHAQKLRCVRAPGGVEDCERCLRLKTSCRFGSRAPRDSLRPGHRDDWHEPTSVAIPLPNVYSDPVMTDGSCSDWLFVPEIDAGITDGRAATIYPDSCFTMPGDLVDMPDFWPNSFDEPGDANTLGVYDSLMVINQNPPSHDTFTPQANSLDRFRTNEEDHPATSPTSLVRDLANLHVALYDCAAQLPSMPEAGGQVTAAITPLGPNPRKKRLFAIDDLFRLTNEFTDLIRHLTHDPGSTSPPTEYAHPGPEPPPFAPIDEATTFLILSCHSRLTSIYLSIFHMMQTCIEFSVAPKEKRDWAIVLPRLQVGAHATAPAVQVDVDTPLPSGTSSMYIMMITMLASRLCGELAGVMCGDGGRRADGGGGDEEGSIPSSWYLLRTTITDGTDRLRGTIDITKQLLQRSALVVES